MIIKNLSRKEISNILKINKAKTEIIVIDDMRKIFFINIHHFKYQYNNILNRISSNKDICRETN